MKKKLIIGLTGPIASGKSSVAKKFARRGAYVIDADIIGHEVLKPQSKAWHAVVRTFGAKILKRGGKVNRKKLGQIVFSDNKALNKLHRISHPEMVRIIKQMITQSTKKVVVINAAILAELKLLPVVDKVVVVLANKKTRLKRLCKKGKSFEYATSRMRTQKSDKYYRSIADLMIRNEKGPEKLKEEADKVIEKLWKNLN